MTDGIYIDSQIICDGFTGDPNSNKGIENCTSDLWVANHLTKTAAFNYTLSYTNIQTIKNGIMLTKYTVNR